jgi:hypothetical protein
MNKILFLLFAVLFSIATSPAEIIPQSRIINWDAGRRGGIPPQEQTIFTTIAPGTNKAGEIQAAIDSCPSGQVVKLQAGTYALGPTAIAMKSNVILRGAGMGQTIITGGESSVDIERHAGHRVESRSIKKPYFGRPHERIEHDSHDNNSRLGGGRLHNDRSTQR